MEQHMTTPVQPAANSKESFQAAVVNYKQQHETLSAQRQQLEANYQQQKTQMESTLLMLSGAIVAVEQIIKNVDDEFAAAKAADDAAKVATADIKAPEPNPEQATPHPTDVLDESGMLKPLQHQPVDDFVDDLPF
jgi:septal ring factor EnvC (AmiA/AmiB activator)